MTPEDWIANALEPALFLLPTKMDTPAARAMCVAIPLQESGLLHRRQGGGGPARGYGQFEEGNDRTKGGVWGVLNHPATKAHIQKVLTALDYDPESDAHACWTAIEHNDILMAAFCRLNLWWLPMPLPAQTAPASGWNQYLAAWKPGAPRRAPWDEYFYDGWDLAT